MNTPYNRKFDRHTDKFDPPQTARLTAPSTWTWERLRELLDRRPGQATAFAKKALARAASLSLIDPFDELVPAYLRWNAQIQDLVFATHPGVERHGRLPFPDGADVHVSLPFEESTYNIVRWEQAFAGAVISRDSRLTNRILSCDVSLLRSSSTRGEGYAYALIEGIRALIAGDPATDPIDRARDLTSPAKVSFSKEWVAGEGVPRVELCQALHVRDETAFNLWLARAVDGHRRLYSKGDERLMPEGFLALFPLALACMAHDAGLNITVVSDYLPMNLIRGDFPRYAPLPNPG